MVIKELEVSHNRVANNDESVKQMLSGEIGEDPVVEIEMPFVLRQ